MCLPVLINGHLSCLKFLVIMNKAAVNIIVQTSVDIIFSFLKDKNLVVELLLG